MNINKNNYQAFFLDYYEGTLTPEQVDELMLFLNEHPELKEEFDDFDCITLEETGEVKFSGKKELKKETVNENNFDEFAVAYFEGLLPEAWADSLLRFAEKNPYYKAQLELYRKTYLEKNENIVFENKSSLKKSIPGIRPAEFAGAGLDDEEYLFIAAVEDALTLSERESLDNLLLHNPAQNNELTAYAKTKLVADTVVYPYKDSLKRRAVVRRLAPFYYAAAASVILLTGFYWLAGPGSGVRGGAGFSWSSSEHSLHHPLPVKGNSNSVAGTKNKNNTTITPLVPLHSPADTIHHYAPAPVIVKNENKDNNSISPPEKQDDSINNVILADNVHKDQQPHNIELVNSFYDPDDAGHGRDDEEGFVSLREMMVMKVKNSLLKDELEDTSYKEDRKRLTWFDAVLVLTKGVRRLTGRDVEVRKKYDANDALIAYEFTAGGRTFTRPVTR